MNNGNLLNSLLGATNANSAATKAASTKVRAETSEKFQQALEQARPEVAARKPVARKESAANEASTAARAPSKTAPPRHSQPETARADSRSKARPDESKAADKTKENAPGADATADKPVDTDQKEALSAEETRDQTQSEHGDTEQDVSGDELTDPTLFLAAGLLVSPDNVPETDSNTNLLEPGDTATDTDVGALPESDVNLVVPDASLSPLAAQAAGEPAGLVAGNLSPLATTGQPALGQGVVASVIASGQSLVDQNVLGDLRETLTSDAMTGEIAEEGESSGDAEGGDNPDFLLLKSSAVLNKLTETNMAASTQDKAAPAVDAAKPAALGAAIESLTRLTEAQSPAARAFVVQTGVPVTVGSPQWSQAVGDKVLWLAAQNVSAAEIRLDPPDLGPMQVKVSLHQDQASVTFTSPHPVVREALDQQLNRLREMFSEQGLNLVNVDVSDKSFAQQEREQQESGKHQANSDIPEEDLVPVAISQAISPRLVDHYA